MKPERWRQIDDLLRSALAQAPAERSAFLTQACAGDELLRREVESLIEADERAANFLDVPVSQIAAELLVQGQAGFVVGQEIGPYRIEGSLGAGGMGEVYLAEDARLGRKLALKLLPDYFTRDADRLRRFEQEARAASSLNHPNIVTIYEIGVADGHHFIATELVEGVTLRERLKVSRQSGEGSFLSGTRVQLNEALDAAVQVAEALAAAHSAHIVHRDIKPENIMIRHDGYVKVVDFGLAKITDYQTSGGTEATTRTLVKSLPGTIMGTVTYMSPEQARGVAVDARTDVWSLGVVLYEMVAGRVPFEGETPTDVILSIVERDPPPLGLDAPETPPELERIVSKALTKNSEERYQTAKDLLLDLRRLKQRMEVAAELERSAPPAVSGRGVPEDDDHASGETTHRPATDAGHVRPTSSAEYLIGEFKQHKRGALAGAVALLIIAAGGAYMLYRLFGKSQPGQPLQSMRITRLTDNGRATAAAISPDGNYGVYAREDEGKQSLWLRQVKSSGEKEIVAPVEENFMGLSFSRDGNFIYYTAAPRNSRIGVLYKVPALGGTPRKVVENVFGPVTLSPDEKQAAFVRTSAGTLHTDDLIVANADGSDERTLTTKRDQAFLDDGPAWSPDGKTIACGAGVEPDYFYESVLAVPVEGGKERWITAHKWYQVSRVAWPVDGSDLIVVARDKIVPASQIWQISYPAGEARRITHDLNSYGANEDPGLGASLSLTVDSNTLVSVQQDLTSTLSVTEVGADESRAHQISNGKFDGEAGVSWTPDGKILCVLRTGDDPDIWLMNHDGTERRQLTADAFWEAWPEMSANGRDIIFGSDRSGVQNIWSMDADGSNQKQLTAGSYSDLFPRFSPDGHWAVFMSDRWTANFNIGKIPLDGGEPVRLTDYLSVWPAVSPDGMLMASGYSDQKDPSIRLAIIPAAGGQPLKLLNIPPGMTIRWGALRWKADGKAITYIGTDKGVSNIWSQPIAGGLPKQLTHFKSGLIFAFDVSPDGRQFALARGTQTRDVVLIRDFR